MHMYRWIESHVVKYVNIVQVKKKKRSDRHKEFICFIFSVLGK